MVLSAVTENRSFYLILIPAVLGMVAAYWNAINRGYNFTAAISPDGIRLRYGLLDTQAQTLPPGRIQALRVSQPPLWRIFGWYRIQVNVAGYGATASNGEASSRTTLLPVGTFPDVLTMLSLVLPDPGTPEPVRIFAAGVNGLAPAVPLQGEGQAEAAGPGTDDGGFVTTPRRARLLAPLGWRRNGFTATDTALLIRSGRWWRHLVVVPHQRTQSMALEQGPLARRFRVADLVLHTTAGPVSPRLIQAGLDEGRALLDAQAARARAARKRQTSEHWLDQVRPLMAGALPHRRTQQSGRPAAWLNQDDSASESSAPARSAPSWGRRCAARSTPSSGSPRSRTPAANARRPCFRAFRSWTCRTSSSAPNWCSWPCPTTRSARLIEGLAKLGAWQPGQLVAHTSGRFGVGILHPVRAAGAIPLALHPAMTFTGMSLDLTRLLDCTFGVTADAAMLPIAQALVVEMGAEPVAIAEADRTLYHAALAHGSNHLVTLVAQASQLLREVGVEAPERMLGPLLRATLENALASGESALTGPVARGDVGTVAAHAGSLREHDGGSGGDILEAYLAMARATARRAGRRGLLKPEQTRDITQALEGPDLDGPQT